MQLIDADTKAPVTNHHLNYYKGPTALGPATTDERGYARIDMRSSNYYSKIIIDVNPNRKNPEAAFRNKVEYKIPDDGNITFLSKKEIVDTVKIYARKVK